MDTIFGVVWIMWMIALFVLYHKVVKVYYFNLGRGLIMELLWSGFIGAFMTMFTFMFWWLTAIIIIIIGLINMRKTNNKIYLIIAVVVAIFISIIGIGTNNKADSAENTASMLQIQQEYMI